MKNFIPTESEAITAKDKITKYIAKHGERVYQDDLPKNIWLLRNRIRKVDNTKCDDKYAYNPITGECGWWSDIRVDKKPNYNQVHATNSGINYGYTHYDPQLKVVCFGFVTIDTSANKGDNDVRLYKWVDPNYKFFMVDGKKSIYDIHGHHINEAWISYKNKCANKRFVVYSGSSKKLWNRMDAESQFYHDERTNEYTSYGMRGIIEFLEGQLVYMGGQVYSEPLRFYQIGEWSQRAGNAPKKRSNSDLVDKYASMELDRHDVSYAKYPMICHTETNRYSSHTRHSTSLWYYDKIDDTTGVFRHYRSAENRWGYSCQVDTNSYGERTEVCRIFVDSSKIYVYNYIGDCVNATAAWALDTHVNPIGFISMLRSHVINADQIWEHPRFKYLKSVAADGLTDHAGIQKLLTLSSHPELESLAKIGCDQIVKKLIQNNEVNANIKEYFGLYKKTKKEPLKMFGLSVTQLKLLNAFYTNFTGTSWCREEDYMPIMLKEYFANKRADLNNVSITAISSNDFQDVINQIGNAMTAQIQCYDRWNRSWNHNLTYWYNHLIPHLPNLTDEDKKTIWKKYYKLCCKDGDTANNIRVLRDTISLYNRIPVDQRPTVNWRFTDMNQIHTLHDGLLQIQQMVEAERRRVNDMKEAERLKYLAEKMRKVDERRKFLEYADDTYSILLPKNAGEIISEGSYLHHCVSGYASSHASGATTIMFLRKNSAIDTPWFTVEVDVPNGCIAQIHGAYNAWLGSSDEAFAAVPFVMKWLKKNNITCAERILTETAHGYGASGIRRALPQIDN